MANRLTKIRVKTVGGRVHVLTLVNHPMETGQRRDATTGALIPAHYIQKITFEHSGRIVAEADLGPGVSKNPLIGVELEDARPGDVVKVSWSDNRGESGSEETTV